MKKIFARAKEKDRAAPGKITPLTLDHAPSPSIPSETSRARSKSSLDGPMLFARPSTEEPDPWVMVSGRPSADQSQRKPQPQARASSSDDDLLASPPPRIESRTSSRASLPPGASPPIPGATTGMQPPPPTALTTLQHNQAQDRNILKKKIPNSQPAATLLRSLEPSDRDIVPPSTPSNPIPPREDHHQHSERDKDKKRPGIFDKKEKDREGRREKERENYKEKEREKAVEGDDEGGQEVSIRSMIGWWSSSSSENWALALHICEAAGQNEANAKEAAKALRKTLKWGDPGPQLSAARLWAIMLRNPSPLFLAEATSPKFLSSLEDVLTKQTTTPVVRSRVLEILMGAAHAYPGPTHTGSALSAFGREKGGGYGALWRKVKPPGMPDEGIPFDSNDPMFNPPSLPNGRNHLIQAQYSPTKSFRTPGRYHKSQNSHDLPIQRVVHLNEDVKRLFEECVIARKNAQLLNEALTYAKPEDLLTNQILTEYHIKCMQSKTIISSQIEWATAQVTKLKRVQQEETGRRISPARETSFEDMPHPRAEELLENILAAHQELAEALRIYDDLDAMAQERALELEAEERSKVDTRLDRTQIQYYSHDGSFQMPVLQGSSEQGGTSGTSRTPSPMPDSSFRSASPQDSGAHDHLRRTSSPQPHTNNPFGPNLIPPSRTILHGPRKPPPRSRSPSPDSRSVVNQLRVSESNLSLPDDVSEDDQPVRPSAKALGKRRMIENFDSETNLDSDDGVNGNRSRSGSMTGSEDGWEKPRWKTQPTTYIYDALVERNKDRDHMAIPKPR